MSGQVRLKKISGGLSDKVDFLREVTTALLDEVKSLGNVKTVEIRNGIDLEQEVKSFEIQLIERALEQTGGSQIKAARLLSLKATTLNEKIKRFAIQLNKIENEAKNA